MAKVDWNGPEVLKKVRAATLDAIDETTAACASQAAAGRSGRSANLTSEGASTSGSRATGRWGLWPEPHGGEAFYELFVEVGNAYRAGDNAKRRAADEQYRRLAGRIRDHL